MSLFIKKYCPKSLDEFEMKTNTRLIVRSLLSISTVNLLLVGGIGTGKSILLNILIREYYGCSIHKKDSSVLEINNLNESGINFLRSEVKTFCQIPSSIPSRRKVIVLDDMDTMNEQSQQIFRNLMDKYSHNVFFMASCSNVHKIIESLQSRFSSIKLSNLSASFLKNTMSRVRKAENISITPSAETCILSVCGKSVHTLLSYLEKFKLLEEKITSDIAQRACTNINHKDLATYTTAIFYELDLLKGIRVIEAINEQGYSVIDILDSYFQFVKITDILSDQQRYEIIKRVCKYITYFYVGHEEDLELSLFTYELYELAV